MMHFKRILIVLMVMIFMTGTLSAEAAAPASSVPPLQPWNSEIVDKITDGYVGAHVSIDHYDQNGRAYVSYYDATNHDLKLAYQVNPGTGDCPGNTNWKCMTLDSGGDVGKFSSIDVIDATISLPPSVQSEISAVNLYHYAKIGISYFDDTTNALKFALRSCVSSGGFPACSWQITTVDDSESPTGDNLGQYSSFNFGTSAQPVIYYHAYHTIPTTVGGIKRAFLPTGNDFSGHCDTGWTCEVVALSTSDTEYGTHISADGGRVAFYNPVNGSLVVANSTGSSLSNNCGLGNYWNCTVIDNVGDVGKFASLHNDGVNPMQVAYYDATSGKVKYAIRTTVDTGNCTDNDFNCFAVDNIGVASIQAHIGISLTLDNEGEPVIAYQDFHEDQAPARLKLARPAYVYGILGGNCGDPVPGPGMFLPHFQCTVLDSSGQTDVNEGDYAAVSVSPSGLATVAYYEDDGYNYEGHLKVTQQHFVTFLPIINK